MVFLKINTSVDRLEATGNDGEITEDAFRTEAQALVYIPLEKRNGNIAQ